jgi:DnaK suppressor protein
MEPGRQLEVDVMGRRELVDMEGLRFRSFNILYVLMTLQSRRHETRRPTMGVRHAECSLFQPMALAKKMEQADSSSMAESTVEMTHEFEQLLLDKQQEILGRLDTNRHNLDEQVMDSPGDVGDESVVDASADYFFTMGETHQRELTLIRDALERLHHGSFGVCTNCSDDIDKDRLRKLPYARFCIDCQSLVEARQRTIRPQLTPKL